MREIIKVKITYNTGFVLETNMSKDTFEFYTIDRNTWYHPKYPTTNFIVEDKEFVSLYGAIKIERI